ncbi:hypothetical protein Poly30_34580 [Planctomycetes bacterium Poly30]|uniref:DUF1800 domain-containing protein n=1 Tax=Saltatorellus ferox TaxID=2528018 RepID=A0A518EV09_9BACT|nr:hypothetical protein Poly30_34580 [Planctomycetes bacterium Poly30]
MEESVVESGSGGMPTVKELGWAAGLAVAAGCSAGGEDDVPEAAWWIQAGPGTDLPADEMDAARFLEAATFGVTADDMTGLQYAGFNAYLDHQRRVAPSLQRPALEAREAAGESIYQNQRQELWWRNAVRGEDQLRQRMAFALSEIFVVSDRSGALQNFAIGLAEYYDVLTRGALGSFRDLMSAVARSPIMGNYLSHLRNQKGDPVNHIRPDENFARELMQLFCIGLIELEPDGTPRLDGDGAEIPTYSQTDIEELSRVMTGWTYAGSANFKWGARDMIRPMEAWPDFHDDQAKTLLGGAVLPAGLTPEEDLEAALDVLFQHANVGPFIAFRLIQRIVTSTPAAGYVQRVAAVFADDGTGQRGNLEAVVRAILLDDEARTGHLTSPTTFGKLREPLVRMAGIWRTFGGAAASGHFRYWNPQNDFGQAALRSGSVFNFFYPTFEPPGLLQGAGLFGPEFQITTHTVITLTANEYYDRIYRAYPGFGNANEHTVTLRLDAELALADDPEALVDHLGLYLMAGQMSDDMRTALVAHVSAVAMDAGNKPDGMQRVLDTIYLIVTSPEGALQL